MRVVSGNVQRTSTVSVPVPVRAPAATEPCGIPRMCSVPDLRATSRPDGRASAAPLAPILGTAGPRRAASPLRNADMRRPALLTPRAGSVTTAPAVSSAFTRRSSISPERCRKDPETQARPLCAPVRRSPSVEIVERPRAPIHTARSSHSLAAPSCVFPLAAAPSRGSAGRCLGAESRKNAYPSSLSGSTISPRSSMQNDDSTNRGKVLSSSSSASALPSTLSTGRMLSTSSSSSALPSTTSLALLSRETLHRHLSRVLGLLLNWPQPNSRRNIREALREVECNRAPNSPFRWSCAEAQLFGTRMLKLHGIDATCWTEASWQAVYNGALGVGPIMRPLGEGFAENFGRCIFEHLSAEITALLEDHGSSTINSDPVNSLVGAWTYFAEGQWRSYHIMAIEDGRMTFVEGDRQGDVIAGPHGFVAELFIKGRQQLIGRIRLRAEGSGVISNWKPTGDNFWGPDIVAHPKAAVTPSVPRNVTPLSEELSRRPSSQTLQTLVEPPASTAADVLEPKSSTSVVHCRKVTSNADKINELLMCCEEQMAKLQIVERGLSNRGTPRPQSSAQVRAASCSLPAPPPPQDVGPPMTGDAPSAANGSRVHVKAASCSVSAAPPQHELGPPMTTDASSVMNSSRTHVSATYWEERTTVDGRRTLGPTPQCHSSVSTIKLATSSVVATAFEPPVTPRTNSQHISAKAIWSASQAHDLGKDPQLTLTVLEKKAPILSTADTGTGTSLLQVIDALNDRDGSLLVSGGLCLFFSANSYWLLWRSDKEEEARHMILASKSLSQALTRLQLGREEIQTARNLLANLVKDLSQSRDSKNSDGKATNKRAPVVAALQAARLPNGTQAEYCSASEGGIWIPCVVHSFSDGHYDLDVQPFAHPSRVRPKEPGAAGNEYVADKSTLSGVSAIQESPTRILRRPVSTPHFSSDSRRCLFDPHRSPDLEDPMSSPTLSMQGSSPTQFRSPAENRDCAMSSQLDWHASELAAARASLAELEYSALSDNTSFQADLRADSPDARGFDRGNSSIAEEHSHEFKIAFYKRKCSELESKERELHEAVRHRDSELVQLRQALQEAQRNSSPSIQSVSMDSRSAQSDAVCAGSSASAVSFRLLDSETSALFGPDSATAATSFQTQR